MTLTTVTTATIVAQVDPSFVSRMTLSIIRRDLLEAGHDGPERMNVR